MALVPEEIPTTSADEATKEFFGYFVEVDCGEEGFYSGRVTQVEPADNNLCTWGKIKLETPFRNGVPLGEQLAIIVPGQLIGNIKVLNMPSQQPQPFVFTPTKPPQIAPQTPRPSISLHQTQHPRISLQQQRTPHQPQHSLQQPPKFPFQPPRFPLQQQPPKLPLQQQPQHSLHQQRFPVQPFSSFPLFERNPVIRTNSGIQGFQRKIFKNRTQNVQITEQNNNKTQKFVPRIVEINNKKAEKVVTPKNVQQQNDSKRMEKSVQKGEQKKRIESTSNQAQKNFENIVKDEKLKEQVARNAELFAKLKIDVQKTIEDQQKTEDLKKIEEQQKLKAQKKKIGDQFKKKIQEHIEKSEEEENKKKIKKEENEEDKNIKNEEKKSLKQQNSFEIQSSSTGPNVGDLASVRCPNGIYQGVVNQINAEEQTIRLEKPLLNGLPLCTNFIDLPHSSMKGVKFYPDDRNGNNRRHSSRELRRPKIFEGVYMQSLPVSSVPRKQSQSERRSDSPKVKTDSEVETRSPTQLAHEEYGEYKKFTEPQIPFPVKLQLNTTPKRHLNNNNSGPTGIPTIDCINGYRGYGDKNNFVDTMGDPLDYETLNTDFDFAANLALFDKAAFTNKIDHVALGLNSSGTNSRNYKHDENVLLDSSRVISWTTNNLAPSSSTAVKNSVGINVAHSLKPCPHNRQ